MMINNHKYLFPASGLDLSEMMTLVLGFLSFRSSSILGIVAHHFLISAGGWKHVLFTKQDKTFTNCCYVVEVMANMSAELEVYFARVFSQ